MHSIKCPGLYEISKIFVSQAPPLSTPSVLKQRAEILHLDSFLDP